MDEASPLPCADKLVFDSKKEAKDQARVLNWRRGGNLKAYKCQYCSLWHLSSQA
jgi:hypothetical protein